MGMMNGVKYIIMGVVLTLFFFAGWRLGGLAVRSGGVADAECRTDTVVVFRTVRGEMPSFVSERELEVKDIRVPQIVYFTDTVSRIEVRRVLDTVTVAVPIIERCYEEMDGRLRMWVKGYEPSLTKWEFDDVQTVRSGPEESRWGFSVTVGPALIWTPFNSCGIDAGLGVTVGVCRRF